MTEMELVKFVFDSGVSVAVIYMLFRLVGQTLPTSAAIQNLTEAINRQSEQQAQHNKIIVEMCMKMGERVKKENASDC